MYRRKKRLLLTMLFISSLHYAYAQTHDLEYYIENATSSSPLLKDYQNRLRTSRIDSLMLRAAHRPQVLANGQVMVAPTIHGYGYDEAITNGGNYAALLSVSQPIFTKNVTAPQYQDISLQNLATRNTARISRLDLKKNITAQYLTAYADYQQLSSNQQVLQLLDAQQNILLKLAQSGIYKQTDYLTFQVALQTQEITIDQLQIQYKADLSTLNYLCGIDDTASVLLAVPGISTNTFPGAPQSVFLKQFEIDSLKIVNNKDAIDARYKPSVNWFADAGLQSSRPSTLYRNFGASFGLNLSIPIYDGKKRHLEYQRLKIAENTRMGYAAFFDHQYNQQRAMLLQQLDESQKLVIHIQDKLKTAQLLIDLDKKLLNAGDLRITDYILAINNYLAIKNNINQARNNQLQIINQLNYWNH